jgi:hypothetical protein
LYKTPDYDLQTVLLEKVGLPDPDPRDDRLAFMPSHLESQEELLSFAFKIDPTLATPNSFTAGFDLYLLPFSRDVVVRALEHEFSINALRIEGIDPLADPQAIYDESYPLSRRIHILTQESTPEATTALLQYLLSPAGQAKIAGIKFLPLPETQ